ncbi:MAG: PIG-L family deacetylase [Saprospiraceae bacterium]|nr:PIG-L family deacetylase [Saprospiraceae bacterium]
MITTLSKKKILVVVAHPDDELLGLGGTMNRLISDYGCECRVIILGEGITSRSDQREPETWKKELEIHRSNIHSAQTAIGYQSVGIYDFPDNRFDSVDLLDIIKVIEKEKSEFQPEVIFTHHGGDVNIDHQRTFEAVITATRPMAHEKVKTIITFETPSGTEWRAASDPKHFIPNLFFDISEENLQAKIKGMESYEFEKRIYPHPRSPEALKILAQRWGVVVGKTLAEAFMLIRHID